MKSTLIQSPPEIPDGADLEDITQRLSSTFDLAIQPVHYSEDELDGDDALDDASEHYACADTASLFGDNFVGPYRILQFISSGGMGEVYAAQRRMDDGKLSMPVALKIVGTDTPDDWRLLERFKREAMIAQTIQSPNVVSIYEYGELEGGKRFLSMELLQGEELFDKLCREKTISPLELADLAIQILKGLHDIHKAGFVHRDIKPENIYLIKKHEQSEVHVKILDFGVAKVAAEKSDPLLSLAGQIYGTPQYLAPEQANSPEVDERADIYSLGVVLYECMTGSRPFDGDSTYAIVHAHQNQPVPPLPSYIDLELGDIILQALEKDPQNRFQSAREMATALHRWLDESSWAEEYRVAQSASDEKSSNALSDTLESREFAADLGVHNQTQPAGPSAPTMQMTSALEVELPSRENNVAQPLYPSSSKSVRPVRTQHLPRPEEHASAVREISKNIRDARHSGKIAAKQQLTKDVTVTMERPAKFGVTTGSSRSLRFRAPRAFSVPPWEREETPPSIAAKLITWGAIAVLLSSVLWTLLY